MTKKEVLEFIAMVILFGLGILLAFLATMTIGKFLIEYGNWLSEADRFIK